MTWYDFLLFVHISMAVIWVGGSTIMQFFGLRAIRASDPMRLVEVGQDIEWIGSRVLLPTSAIAVLSGVLMVIDSDFWGFGDDWILLGILLLIVFDMAVKPQWGDASLWIAVLAFAALAVLLVRNGMNARLGAVAASAAE